MTSRLRRIGATVGLVVFLTAPLIVHAQPGVVEKIIPQGLGRMSERSFLEAFGIRSGDPYDPAQIRKAFRSLWELGVFSNITIEAEDGAEGGKVLIVKVTERPTLSSVTYEDNKVVTRTQIEDRLREREAPLDIGRPLDMKRVFDAEATIRDLLAEKGYLEAKVSHVVKEVTKTSNSVNFNIRPGGKTRVRNVRFKGNEVFGNRRLKKELKLTKPWRWYWPFSGKSLYHPIKWDQDVGGVRDLYQNAGYLDVEIRPPVIEAAKEKKDGKKEAPAEVPPKRIDKIVQAQKRRDQAEAELAALRAESPPEDLSVDKREKWTRNHEKRVLAAREKVKGTTEKLEKAERKAEPGVKRWVNLIVTLTEGRQYRMAEISVDGNTVFNDDQLLVQIPLRKGLVLSSALLKLGVDRITRLYGDRGYLYANVVRRIQRHEDEPVADVVVTIDEDQPYNVETIEFSGNTATHDRVLRREFRLDERELFSRTKLDVSVRKVNQLGYFEAPEDPLIEPLDDRNLIKITVPGQEKGRNEIQVGGGYSGLDGAFFTGLYSTRNFLGRGQVLSTSIQVGGRSNRYSISFLEPYFLGRPYTLGFSLFRRDVDYGGNLTSSGEGGGIVLGRQLGIFSAARLNYNFENATSTGFTLGGGSATSQISSLTPVYIFNKVNNPFRPSGGWSFESQVQVAGGALGGDSNFLKPLIRYTGYWRAIRRAFLGLNVEVGQVRAFDEATNLDNRATVEGIPRFQRFWIGGDTFGPRVFETRAVTPLRFVKLTDGRITEVIKDPTDPSVVVADFDLNGDGILNRSDLVELGGDRFFLFQTELVYPVNKQFDFAFFLDAGNSLYEDTSWGFEDARVSAGIELRFYLPIFPAPLRLIYGVPVQELPGDRTSNFTFSIGRSF